MEIEMRHVVGESTISHASIAIVSGSFYTDIGESLLSATTDCLLANGVNDDDITVYHVPGALEIPLIVQKLAETSDYDAIIALGCVIRGETAHFEYVSEFSSFESGKIAMDFGIPVINGILTVENRDQAEARAHADKKNKGQDFGLAAIQMINLLKKI